MPNTILLIGASRGLGLALAEEWLKRGHAVIATVRSSKATPLNDLAKQHTGRLTIEQLEMNDEAQLETLAKKLADTSLDLLFVNAAIALGAEDRVATISTDDFNRVMITNALSPMRIIERFGPQVKPTGTIAAMTSGLGSVSQNTTGGWEVYRASKSALNQFMRSYAASDPKRSVLVMDPGWVQTDMGGPNAQLTIDQSIPHLVTTLERHHGKPGSAYLNYKGETVAW